MKSISSDYLKSLNNIAQQFLVARSHKKLLDNVLKQVLTESSQLNGKFDFAILVIKHKTYLKINNVLKMNLKKKETLFKTRIKGAFLPLHDNNNLLVEVFNSNKLEINYSFAEILHPPFSIDKCYRLQNLGKIKSNVLLPLNFKNESLGVLILGSKKKLLKISKREQIFFRTLSNLMAAAIENYFLLEEQAKDKKKLEKANQKLREIDQLKDEFVSVASHELRTPMTAIKNYLWLVLNRQKENLNDKSLRYVEIAYKSSDRMIGLVKDMLTMSRIESKRFALRKTSFDLEDLLREIVAELQGIASSKNIKLVFKSTHKDIFLKADRAKIAEVIQNIIDNGLKFTPDNGTVEISLFKKGIFAVVKIKDSGPGISKKNQTQLFQKFSRLEHSYSELAQTFGTGLGLYISKKIVDLHEGNIKINSDLGKGSEFIITLPIDINFYFKKKKK